MYTLDVIRMKIFSLLFPLLLAGCVVMNESNYLGVADAENRSYDSFHDTYLFQVKGLDGLVIEAGAFKSKSKSIGVLVPIVPQIDRSARLTYDIESDRRIKLTNKSQSEVFYLSELDSCIVTENEFTKTGRRIESDVLNPGESIWLIFPAGDENEIMINSDTISKKLKIKSFSKNQVHLVSV
jgi:hypothetical protein